MTTTITITAAGEQGCGKTRTLELIRDALQLAGITGNVKDFSEHHLVIQEGFEGFSFEIANPTPSPLFGIFKEIAKERRYQEGKWGNTTDDTKNTPWMWVSYIAGYATRWMQGEFSITKSSADRFRSSMIKTATTCAAAAESLDRQRQANGAAFYEEADPEPITWRIDPSLDAGYNRGPEPFGRRESARMIREHIVGRNTSIPR